MTDPLAPGEEQAERIRQALLAAALAAYEDAGIQGLCEEGRWEAAVGAMRRLDLRPLDGREPHGAR